MTDTATETDATEEMGTFVVTAPPSIPFDDTENPSKDFEVTKDVDAGRLRDEITEAIGQPVQVIVSYPHGVDTPPDKSHPAVVYVSADEEFDGRKVRGVITSHDIDAEPEEGSLAACLKALRAGEDLDLAGVSTVLRMLVGG